MLIFNLKKQWFDKIKSGEKTHEYREVKSYWTKRFMKINAYIYDEYYDEFVRFSNDFLDDNCVFVCGYASKEDKAKRLKAKIKSISIVDGKNTDLAVDRDVYDIEFEIIRD